nr:DUF1801 domain-containing protein [uncultured Fluviicola sp.]
MRTEGTSPEQVIANCPEERQEAMIKLRKTILDNLPGGFMECINNGMIGYVVPHSLYPPGYHCDPKLPLPFLSFASQKNFIAFYHMGIYGNKELLEWFVNEFQKISKTKPDMGKSCVRFKKPDQIPFELIGKLVSKISPQEWIACYEKVLNRK